MDPHSERDLEFLQRAVELALEAEANGNLPIGALLILDGETVAEGASTLLQPTFDPGGHAEINAVRSADPAIWERAAEVTCYTTLEPCIMCFGTLVLHGVGRIVFGAHDVRGGARFLRNHLPPFYDDHPTPTWDGPLLPVVCDPLYERADARFEELFDR
jgi:tRNA(adenine34) deaminase